MGAFSVGAVVSVLAGVVVGRLIDARGPRQVMTTGSVLAIAAAPSLPLSCWQGRPYGSMTISRYFRIAR